MKLFGTEVFSLKQKYGVGYVSNETDQKIKADGGFIVVKIGGVNISTYDCHCASFTEFLDSVASETRYHQDGHISSTIICYFQIFSSHESFMKQFECS